MRACQRHRWNATPGLAPAAEKLFLRQVPFLEPEPYELAAYGEGGGWPFRRGEPAPATDWKNDFGGASSPLKRSPL